MRFNQQQIVAFNAACTHGSFSAAARKLGVTQSSVTQHIAKFETVVEPLIGRQLEVPQALAALLDVPGSFETINPELGELFP